MANAIRTALFVIAVTAAATLVFPAAATTEPGLPTSGVTPLGAGFSGKPFVLDGDVVIETIGLYEAIRDYQDAASPQWIAWYDHTLDGIWQEILHEDGLLVALRDPVRPGFEVLDVTDPSAPVALASFDANHFRSGWLRGDALIVAQDDYLIAYDLADPTEPQFAHLILLGHHERPRGFSALGSHLFLVDHDATIRVLDVSDPLAPVDLGAVVLPGRRIDAMTAGDGVLHLLVANDGSVPTLDLVTYDVSDPLAPRETARLVHSTATDATGVQLERADQLLLAADDGGLVRAYDLTDPEQPLPGYELPFLAERLAISDHQVFVMTAQDVRIFPRTPAQTPPAEPVVRSLLPRLRTIDGEGPVQVGQLHSPTSVLVPIDASNPRHPRLGQPLDTGVPGAFFYGASLGIMVNLNGSFQLVGFADPLSPTLLGGVTEPRLYFFRAELAPGLAVIETGSVEVELRFYDLADPMSPRFFAKVYDYGLEDVDGDVMVCSRSDRIRIYDLSDLARPLFVRQLEMPGAVEEVVLHQQHAYVLARTLSGDKFIHAVRLADPRYPELVASLPLSHNAGRLDAHDGRLYAYGYHLCQIFDIAAPAQMAVVAEFPAFGHTGSGLAFNGAVTTIGGWLVTMRDDGLTVSSSPDRVPAPASRLEAPFPNPLNPSTTLAFTLGRDQDLALSVHDLRGRLVARLASGRFEAGRHTVRWDGQDGAGMPVASGVYLVRLHGRGLEASRTVTIVR